MGYMRKMLLIGKMLLLDVFNDKRKINIFLFLHLDNFIKVINKKSAQLFFR